MVEPGRVGIAALLILLFVLPGPLRAVNFDKLFYFSWSSGEPERWGEKNEVIALKLTMRSGSGFASKNPLFHGRYGGKIKLPAGFTAGVIVAFYLTSSWDPKWTETGIDRHDEIDFEFLGNVSSGDIEVQTNWYAGGLGDHEERHRLWFDPAADFHEYEVHWNWEHILWLVDGIPIRREARQNPSGTYPTLPMFLMGSIWEASSWATLGGTVPIDWSKEPYYVAFKDLHMEGCYWRNLETPEPPFCAKEDFIASWDEGLGPKEPDVLSYAERHYTYYSWSKDEWRLSNGMGIYNESKVNLIDPNSDRIKKGPSNRKRLMEVEDLRLRRPWIRGIPGWPGVQGREQVL